MEQLEQEKEARVGVVIPCHNYGKYVVDAIESTINQDYHGNIDIFVVNDGSSDDTVEQVKGMFADQSYWIEKDGYIYVDNITGENTSGPNWWNNRRLFLFSLINPTGPSNARNVGIELAFKENCEIIAFLDADDMMVDSKLSILVEELGDGAVYADYYHLYPDGTFRIELKEPFDLERFMHENIGPNNTSIVTRKALETIKENGAYFDPSMRTCEDYDLFRRISEKFQIKHVAEPLTFLRVHDNNSTNTVNQEVWIKDRKRVDEKTIQRQNSCK